MKRKIKRNKNNIKEMNSWDYNLDFDYTYKMLSEDINLVKKDIKSGKLNSWNIKKLSYCCLGLLELRNGCRIGEAIEALIIFCENLTKDIKNREIRVLTEKRKDDYLRKIVLPEQLHFTDLKIISQFILKRNITVYYNTKKKLEDKENLRIKKQFVCTASKFFVYNYNHSSHALRYSWITHMGCKKGMSPQNIAKLTGHKTLELVLHYTGKKIAEAELSNMFK
ncbi:MAG: tyrosine-type recombinase/integrase [Cyanobacteriota bacterium]